jgi:hypothetical protein
MESGPAWPVPPRLDRLRNRRLGPIIAGFALVQLSAWAYGSFAPKTGKAEMSHLITHARQVITEESLPPELAGWERVHYTTEFRGPDSLFAMYSNIWTYRRGGRQVLISLDYPFRGWHELTACYRSIEWNIGDRVYAGDESDSGTGSGAVAPHASTAMDRGDGRHARLMFGLVDDRGDWIEQPSRPLLRGRELPWEESARRPAYQIQALCTSFAPLRDEDQQQVEALFEASRQALREQLFASGAITL